LFTIRTRAFSFLLVFGMGLLLLVFVILDTFLTALNLAIQYMYPDFPILPPITGWIVPFFMVLFFAVIFKTLPDVRLRWGAVWWGAAVTTLLFTLGSVIIGRILVRSSTGSIYGAAGALIILLVWIYYSAQIVFFGAEFTKVYAVRRYGGAIEPRANTLLLHEFYENAFANVVEVDRAAAAENAPLATIPPEAQVATQLAKPGYVSPRYLAIRQTAAALLGLAAGLFVGFLGSLRRGR
jgi:hypothetical protein